MGGRTRRESWRAAWKAAAENDKAQLIRGPMNRLLRLLRERAKITSHLLTGRRGADTRVCSVMTPRDAGRDESRPGRLKPAPRQMAKLQVPALARWAIFWRPFGAKPADCGTLETKLEAPDSKHSALLRLFF